MGEPSLESVLLSDEFMLVSLTLGFTTLAVITCIVSTTVNADNMLKEKQVAPVQTWYTLLQNAEIHNPLPYPHEGLSVVLLFALNIQLQAP